MVRPGNSSLQVYLYAQPVDMRKQIDGLSALVEQSMTVSAFSKSLFVFVNKRKDKLKILYWEKNGFVIWHKRLEDNRFCWPKAGEPAQVSVKELNMLLDGYDIFRFKPHAPLKSVSGMTTR
ncbi:IS66 family insertion sequence element accessory protein TnpB [Marinomonas transparens]|uniref:IS66 family insertion sequence element accessory protein TnpB n=1 Tax=Marinomonas transparens TaxID=2795388 RepID=A0A934N0U8_9GAMM|nr:IS66 family insertion sequence element accessory protein TnpB [Marinomonas transparens]MBJ7537082.1 IS66 family insertion sequence element accessory protein TnpB [Marinomonas transparens]